MARRVLIIANVVAVVVVITWGLLAALVSTDRSRVRSALDRSGTTMAALLQGADTAPSEYAAEQKKYVSMEIERYFDFDEDEPRSNSGSGIDHGNRIEWSGTAPKFTGTRIIASTRSGGELGTLTVRDLSARDWEIETVSPLLFWR